MRHPQLKWRISFLKKFFCEIQRRIAGPETSTAVEWVPGMWIDMKEN